MYTTLSLQISTHTGITQSSTSPHYTNMLLASGGNSNFSGNHTPNTHYLLDHNNMQHYNLEAQETLHREVWSRIYKKKKKNTDDETTHTVTQHIGNNLHRITAHSNADPSRFKVEPILTPSMSTE